MRSALGVAIALTLGFVSSSPAAAQSAAIKPYFVVVFDDSGSMGSSTGGGTNSCGESQTRLNDAKCALTNVVDAFGDVIFNLVTFKTFGSSPATRFRVPELDPAAGTTTFDDYLDDDNQIQILEWVDFSGSGGLPNPEINASGVTPIRDTLDEIRDVLERSNGPIANDPANACRPYFVILLTDGDSCCNSQNSPANAALAAERLLSTSVPGVGTVPIETFVIFFGAATPTANANSIANAGDPATPSRDAIAAVNEEALAQAFTDIISAAILTETCNDADDDCDGAIDEGFVKYCDRDGLVGVPTSDPRAYCTNPGDDCDDSDDNCFDGTADEPVGACGTCDTPLETCDLLDNDCDGTVDENVCAPGCTPTGRGETCNDLDDDCDTRIDEGVTRSCGRDLGICTRGTQTCTAGVFGACVGETAPGTETCNGLDDDCDGRVDGISQPCGSDEGLCRAGVRICTDGSFGGCIGEIGPAAEVCDGLDNDCDGSIDEAMDLVDATLGDACGSATGECVPGVVECVTGALVCVGEVGPTEETCNGLDDDCDGLPDDGLGVGAPCGIDTGICQPGVTICRGGMTVCEGEISPIDELCNALDDDCDGTVDEGLPLGEACGSDEGVCQTGIFQCNDGIEVCSGEIPSEPEQCDCEDNDCDGAVDETGGESLCPEGTACVECGCSSECRRSEFGFSCPGGRTPFFPDGVGTDTCFCVRPQCDAATCALERRDVEGETVCGPETGIDCICKNNRCTFPCDGVSCSGGLVCDPRDGSCVADTCVILGCDSGELCNATSGDCEPDPCASITCGDEEACRDGRCVGSCADVTCDAGQVCVDGGCVDDACADVSCGAGEVCVDGSCVEDLCEGSCPADQVCDPATGDCVNGPCFGLTCPDGQSCDALTGQCVSGSVGDMGGTPDAGTETGSNNVLAAGGGGLSCATTGGQGGQGAPFALLLLLLALRPGRRWRLAQARRAVTALGVGALALTTGGCDVDPFCIDDCNESIDGFFSDMDVGEGGLPDGGDGGVTDAGPDFGPDAGCVPGAPELCNERDDDCDELVDEGIDTTSSLENCGGCGLLCAPSGAFGVCEDGVCGIDRCDVQQYDLDGDPTNGCEYRCGVAVPAADDTECNRRDDDCDGTIDEDVLFATDVANCGECGRTCAFPNASATCEEGACVLGDCDENFFDIDGFPATGCEYSCTPAGAEVCNGRDDDCDATIDEPGDLTDPTLGDACGTDVGACVAGTLTCVSGTIRCEGEVGPTAETCNDVDDDCDGLDDVAEGLVDTDLFNCGACGNVCMLANAFAACVGGSCELVTCQAGFFDVDGLPGCEYACTFAGAESCNGNDDDCDGLTDEDVIGPDFDATSLCGALGVCATGTARCDGAAGIVCDLPTTFEVTETTCDGLDNDCDGQTDEPFTPSGLGDICSNGVGECQRTGTIVCNGAGTGTECNAAAAGSPTDEVCDGRDNDCDGEVDERFTGAGSRPPSTPADFIIDDLVQVGTGAGAFWMYRYEASRPDASASSVGGSSARACSRVGVLPWTNVSYTEAEDACVAAGFRLCTEAEWEQACQSTTGTCRWSYEGTGLSCTTYSADTCNGNDYDTDPGTAGDQDDILVTGDRNQCRAQQTGVGANDIFDLSGNVKEWAVSRPSGANPLRGGASNNPAGGIECDFDFTVADDFFQIDNVGFRCCSDEAP